MPRSLRSMRRPRVFIALLVLLLGLPGGSRAEEPLRVSGTGTALGTMRRLAAAFESANPGSRIRILTSVGSGGAFKAVAKGALDLGLAARPLSAEEYALGLVSFPFARTPFLFAVGPRAGVTELTAADAVRIYGGELQTWPSGERIRLVLRPRTDADSAILAAISPELAAAAERAQAREGMLIALTNQESNAILVRTPGALGLSSLAQVVTEGLAVTPLSWNGVAPTVPNLLSGAYPLQKTLYIVIKAPASPAALRFFQFLASPQARLILEQCGNVALPVPPIE